MAKVKVHAGDFKDNSVNAFNFGTFNLVNDKHRILGESIPAKNIETLEIANEENVKKLAGTAGWAIAGAVVFGPVGALAGLLLGGKKKEVTFIAVFKDGRKVMATTDSKTYTQIQAACFK